MNPTANQTEADDIAAQICDAIRQAAAEKRALRIRGGNTKTFYGREEDGETLDTRRNSGIVAYEPAELVVTARNGTLLSELEETVAEQGQMLAFEPPHFGAAATLGGTIACGFSGPRRPYAGAARDFVLGIVIVNGRGELLRFGGQVIKNVAGYDVSRLMVGAMGALGVMTEVSLKVLPAPVDEATVCFQIDLDEAIRQMTKWMGQASAISATCHDSGNLYVRLSGSENSVRSAKKKIGGDELKNGKQFWLDLKEQRLDFFRGNIPLWRLSVPSATSPLSIEGRWLLEWSGALRWLRTDIDARTVREIVARTGGHATLFRNPIGVQEVFHPLTPAMFALHKNLKQAFDPHGILNRGRVYPEL